MKLLVIGGTGKTGREIIKQGLSQGHVITAVVRNPSKVKYSHTNLKVLKGNVLIPKSYETSFQGQDAVLSALGHKKFIIKTTILSRGTKNIITAMERNNVKRLICITSLGVNDSKFKLGLYYTLFTIPFILFFYFLDKSKQEKLIMNSELEWTIVRPGQLTNGKKRTIYKHGKNVGHYLLTKMISRADVAHFMLNLLKQNTYLKKTVGLTY
ncbi:MAG: SDR family oxidoreductase [Algibacter sp.]|uniref:NAD(P)-dependent oxidoreductase n=1 Tax=Algibacter sp. TaxID=1872428 RepID=UPI00329A7546